MATFQKRSGAWRAIVTRKGFDRLSRTFDTRVDAETWARQIESEIDRGVFVSRKEAENTTLSEALDRYEREIIVKKKEPPRKNRGSGSGKDLPWQNASSYMSREKMSPPIGMPASRKSAQTPSVWNWPFSLISLPLQSRNGGFPVLSILFSKSGSQRPPRAVTGGLNPRSLTKSLPPRNPQFWAISPGFPSRRR